MKHLLAVLAALSVMLVGCGPTEAEKQAEHMREMECIQLTGDRYCRGNGEATDALYNQRLNQAQMAGQYQPSMVDYGPVQPGQYTNYYGSPQHGQWAQDGRYYFNDPNSSYASSTNAFLLGAGLGGLATYAATKMDWSKKNPNGWTNQTTSVKSYVDKSGKTISADEYSRRKAQSDKDRNAYMQKYNQQKAKSGQQVQQLKKQRDESLKRQQQLQNQAKSQQKPPQLAIEQKKAELRAKLDARRAAKATTSTNSGFSGYAQKESNTTLKQKLKQMASSRSSGSYKSSGLRTRKH